MLRDKESTVGTNIYYLYNYFRLTVMSINFNVTIKLDYKWLQDHINVSILLVSLDDIQVSTSEIWGL